MKSANAAPLSFSGNAWPSCKLMSGMTRRILLQSAATLAAATALPAQPAPSQLKICVFSKHLRFLEGEALAKATKEMGFDGIDLAVRANGHIEPARVRQLLPALVSIIRKHGLEVPMLTTDIMDADTPFADDVLATMTELGIHHYRWGGYKWTKD